MGFLNCALLSYACTSDEIFDHAPIHNRDARDPRSQHSYYKGGMFVILPFIVRHAANAPGTGVV
jgi:hypothetical protein